MFVIPDRFTRKLWRQADVLRKLERRIDAEPNVEARRRMARVAWRFAVVAAHNRWSSPSVESVYREWSESLTAEMSAEFEPATCLFVLTKACAVGGLEQLVYRWIGSDSARRYSVALTHIGEEEHPPAELERVVLASGGCVEQLWKGSAVDAAIRLRTLASRYEMVVLFTYEDDEVPILAFGTDKFQRPVGLYNQCDHHFWANVSIADLVADMRPWGQDISLHYRGVSDSVIVPIVTDFAMGERPDKEAVRRKLSLDPQAKVVVSASRAIKYKSVCGLDFMALAAPILRDDAAVQMIIIGPTRDEMRNWNGYFKEFGSRLQVIGEVPHKKLVDYYHAADLVLDSFPICGQTTSTDAVRCGCPILTTSQTLHFLVAGGASCPDAATYVRRALELLHDETKAQENVRSVSRAITELMSIDVFKSRRDAFLSALAMRRHAVREFTTASTNDIFQDYLKVTQEVYGFKDAAFLAMRESGGYRVTVALGTMERVVRRYYNGLMRRMKRFSNYISNRL